MKSFLFCTSEVYHVISNCLIHSSSILTTQRTQFRLVSDGTRDRYKSSHCTAPSSPPTFKQSIGFRFRFSFRLDIFVISFQLPSALLVNEDVGHDGYHPHHPPAEHPTADPPPVKILFILSSPAFKPSRISIPYGIKLQSSSSSHQLCSLPLILHPSHFFILYEIPNPPLLFFHTVREVSRYGSFLFYDTFPRVRVHQ